MSVGEVDVFFVENGGPLEGCSCTDYQHVFKCETARVNTVQLLASLAMAVFRVEGLLSAQLVLDLPTVTATMVSHLEVGVVVVHFVRCTELPLVEFTLELALVTIVAILACVVIDLSLRR